MSHEFDFTSFTSAPDACLSFFDEPLDFSQVAQFESINHPAPAQNVKTVSPKDIMVDSMSAPPSTTFTDLTTPGTSTFESPWISTSTETSPLFSEDELGDNAKDWPSLFEPMDETPSGPAAHYTASPTIMHVAPHMSRNDSSPGQNSSRSSNQGRHSFTSGVAPKRRDKPLPAITIEDPNDSVAVKRARNTMAARKSRQKRNERTEQLESEVATLEAEVEHWKNIALSKGYVE